MAVVGVVVVALAAGATPARGVINVIGFTWYSDGSFNKSAVSGTVITAYATGAKANAQYRLMFAPPLYTGEACPDTGKQNVNPNVRTSSSSGLIGNTSGAITAAPGSYYVCFYELGAVSASATAPVYLTIV